MSAKNSKHRLLEPDEWANLLGPEFCAVLVAEAQEWRNKVDEDKLNNLLISHDELMIVCRTQMNIILRAGLHKRLDKELSEAKVQPGFAERSEKSQTAYKRERLLLMSTGAIQ